MIINHQTDDYHPPNGRFAASKQGLPFVGVYPELIEELSVTERETKDVRGVLNSYLL